ncbi:MAG: hypothetical protein WCC69_11815 [Pirellulales bacterium]
MSLGWDDVFLYGKRPEAAPAEPQSQPQMEPKPEPKNEPEKPSKKAETPASMMAAGMAMLAERAVESQKPVWVDMCFSC